MGIIRTHYLDASAIVKIVANEPDSSIVRQYFGSHTNYRTTSVCFVEALMVLKAKCFCRHPPQISRDRYLDACNLLLTYVRAETIDIEEIEIAESDAFTQVERITKNYNIDVSDSYQIYTVKTGFFSAFRGADSEPILITADSGLAGAAREEGVRVWNCTKEPPP